MNTIIVLLIHSPSQCELMLQNRPIHLKTEKATDGKEMVNIITQDNVRDLLVPSHNINVYPTIWQSNEMNRIKTAGRIVTRAERQQRLEQNESEKKRLEEESEKRKKILKEIDLAKVVKKKTSFEKSDREDIDNLILDRAFIAKQEQVKFHNPEKKKHYIYFHLFFCSQKKCNEPIVLYWQPNAM